MSLQHSLLVFAAGFSATASDVGGTAGITFTIAGLEEPPQHEAGMGPSPTFESIYILKLDMEMRCSETSTNRGLVRFRLPRSGSDYVKVAATSSDASDDDDWVDALFPAHHQRSHATGCSVELGLTSALRPSTSDIEDAWRAVARAFARRR